MTPLQDQLDEITANTRHLVQPERLAVGERAVEELFASGIEDRILPVGAIAPEFALKDATGQLVRSRRPARPRSAGHQVLPRPLVPLLRHRARSLARPLRPTSASAARSWSPSARRPSARATSWPASTACPSPSSPTPATRVAEKFGLVYTVPEYHRDYYLSILVNIPFVNGDKSWRLPLPATYVIAKDGKDPLRRSPRRLPRPPRARRSPRRCLRYPPPLIANFGQLSGCISTLTLVSADTQFNKQVWCSPTHSTKASNEWAPSFHWGSIALCLCKLTPRSRNTLLRDSSPLTSSTDLLGMPNVSARNAISASFARPSTGGACTAIFNCAASPSPYTPTIAVFFAPGCARTASVTPPAPSRSIAVFIQAAPHRALACQTAPFPPESASRPLQSPAQNPRSSPSKALRDSAANALAAQRSRHSRKLRKQARVTSSAAPHGAIVISPRISRFRRSGSRSSSSSRLIRLRLQPFLRLLRTELHLDQHRQPLAQLPRRIIQPLRQPQRVHRIDRVEQLRRPRRLVRLQMSDQM